MEEELFKTICRILNILNTSYMITGGIAVSAWGKPRLTHDLDIIIAIQPKDKEKVVKTFSAQGWYIDEAAISLALQDETTFNVIIPDEGLKIDFWILKRDFYSQESFQRRIQQKIFGEDIYLISSEDLILAKLQWFTLSKSSRHLLDAHGVYELQKENLDTEYLKKWAKELNLEELLKDLFENKFSNL